MNSVTERRGGPPSRAFIKAAEASADGAHGRALELAVWCADQTAVTTSQGSRNCWIPIRESASQLALAVVEALLLPRRREALQRADQSSGELRERVVAAATAGGASLEQVRYLLDELDLVETQVASMRRADAMTSPFAGPVAKLPTEAREGSRSNDPGPTVGRANTDSSERGSSPRSGPG